MRVAHPVAGALVACAPPRLAPPVAGGGGARALELPPCELAVRVETTAWASPDDGLWCALAAGVEMNCFADAEVDAGALLLHEALLTDHFAQALDLARFAAAGEPPPRRSARGLSLIHI